MIFASGLIALILPTICTPPISGMLMSVTTISGKCVLKSSNPVLPLTAVWSATSGNLTGIMAARISKVSLSSSTSKIEINGMGSVSGFIAHLYPEFGAIGNVAHTKSPPHILLYDGLGHEQTDPRSPLWTLGGKMRVEDLAQYLLGDASGVVGNGYDGTAVFM